MIMTDAVLLEGIGLMFGICAMFVGVIVVLTISERWM